MWPLFEPQQHACDPTTANATIANTRPKPIFRGEFAGLLYGRVRASSFVAIASLSPLTFCAEYLGLIVLLLFHTACAWTGWGLWRGPAVQPQS